MSSVKISDGVVHKLPVDMRKVLLSAKEARTAWEDITPLARNEWICWVEEARKSNTRANRIKRTKIELIQGKRRPCCWVGCTHRPDKPISPSQKWVLDKMRL